MGLDTPASAVAPAMKPHLQLAATQTPDGAHLTLHAHDGTFCIRQNGRELMHSAAAASELALGEVGTDRLVRDRPARVLVGGLGLGFTLRRVLERAGPRTAVQVVELLPEIVAWNREFLSELNGRLLEDPRVELAVADVFAVLQRAGPARYDAILLDIDNGPVALVQQGNARLYAPPGLRLLATVLAPGGRLVVWSAGPDRAFEQRLAQAGFRVETVPVPAHPGARQNACRLFVADKAAVAPTVRR